MIQDAHRARSLTVQVSPSRFRNIRAPSFACRFVPRSSFCRGNGFLFCFEQANCELYRRGRRRQEIEKKIERAIFRQPSVHEKVPANLRVGLALRCKGRCTHYPLMCTDLNEADGRARARAFIDH
jgi:hypothetical protein